MHPTRPQLATPRETLASSGSRPPVPCSHFADDADGDISGGLEVAKVFPLLQAMYIGLHRLPVDAGPRLGLRFSGRFSECFHRLTSPKIRSLQMLSYRQDQSEVSTLSGWVSPYGPIPLITSGRSLLPTSQSPCTYTLPRGQASTGWWGVWGFPSWRLRRCGLVRLVSMPRWELLCVITSTHLLQHYPLTILVTV